MFSNVQATLAGKSLSREFMSPARAQLALYTLPVYISSPVVAVIPISCSSRVFRVFMSGFSTFIPKQIPAAPQLEPSFEMTLRAADISEEVITGFRVHKIKTAAIFAVDGYYRGRTQRNSS